MNLFSDDTMFTYTSIGKRHAVKQIQKILLKTLQWLKERRITINVNKTLATLFRGKSSSGLKKIKINGQFIEWSDSVKYLRVTLDSKLNFSKHINNTYNKARRIRAALYPMLKLFSHLPFRGKLIVIKLYINFIFSYAGPAWGALVKEYHCTKLEAVQNVT